MRLPKLELGQTTSRGCGIIEGKHSPRGCLFLGTTRPCRVAKATGRTTEPSSQETASSAQTPSEPPENHPPKPPSVLWPCWCFVLWDCVGGSLGERERERERRMQMVLNLFEKLRYVVLAFCSGELCWWRCALIVLNVQILLSSGCRLSIVES